MEIKSVSPYVAVYQDNPAPYVDPYTQSAGMVRYSGQRFEVYDGYGWITISPSYNIDLTSDVYETIMWARQKIAEEKKLAEAMEKFPALKTAFDNYELIKRLVASHEQAE